MNFLDEEHQAGLKGLKFAYEQGMGVIIMEPLRGGSLADPSRISEDIKELGNNPARSTHRLNGL